MMAFGSFAGPFFAPLSWLYRCRITVMARRRPGHPRLQPKDAKTWMPGIGRGMDQDLGE